ncbi:MAG TPA: hypothetical protein VID68_06610 [Solirubrobacteraceae bacterium]|jgi:hypothetical protein
MEPLGDGDRERAPASLEREERAALALDREDGVDRLGLCRGVERNASSIGERSMTLAPRPIAR